MNTIWSDNIQGIKTLYLSRKLRFDNFFHEQYKALFQLDQHKKLRILEIGCGPGAFADALHRWYPNAEIVAIDRDSNFIKYAKETISGVNFMEGDATALPFEANAFDVINEKYDSRIALYSKGDKQWDTNTSITMIIRGINQKSTFLF